MTNLGNKETFAKNLSYYIDKSGKTKKDIAEIVGVAPSTLNEWTKGKKYPRIDKIEILANYFRILKSDLIEEQVEERREMLKKNDALSDIVVKLRTDDVFFSIVGKIHKLNADKLNDVNALLSAFLK